MSSDTITITDNRTGKSYEIPITHDTINAMDLRQIKVNPDDFGMMTYDPGFKNTASTKSTITYIDGDKGILRYRGYPIEQLASSSNYLGSGLSDPARRTTHAGPSTTSGNMRSCTTRSSTKTCEHIMDAFRYDAHPMSMFISTVAALPTFYPEARNISDPDVRMRQIIRLVAKVPTIAAFSYRHCVGCPMSTRITT